MQHCIFTRQCRTKYSSPPLSESSLYKLLKRLIFPFEQRSLKLFPSLVFSKSLMRIRDLIRRLLRAGFILQPGQGRGSHRVYDHPHGQTVTIPGHDNGNAPPYLIREVRDAIEASGGTWEG
ncbi:type II toxin-antitoxin system HicA family toxin [Akkermansia sp. NBRC 115031]|uniref:type II toxin-antitoxin system HicA family toxin n=2 Tax=Akkermansia TaxID=239934 RepID=UPI0031F318E1